MAEVNARYIQRKLKLSGLEVRRDALSAIESTLKREDDPRAALDKLLGSLKERLASSNRASCIVDRQLVLDAVVDLSKDDQDMIDESIQVWDAFRIPHVRFNPSSRKFEVAKTVEPLHGAPEAKTEFLAERYRFVSQRVMRHPMFATNSARSGSDTITLTSIDSLAAGSGDTTTVHHVLGILTRVDEESLWLEDPTGRVALDLPPGEVTYGEGYFTVGCAVIVAGTIISSADVAEENAHAGAAGNVARNLSLISKHYMLRVSAMMMPPMETRANSELAYPGVSRKLLGLGELSSKDSVAMDAMELESDSSSFIMLSEVYLDDPQTMQGLRKLFEGIEEHPPDLFVLMGNFSRRPFGFVNRHVGSEQVSAAEYSALFENLANLMNNFPSLLQRTTKWVFIPGPRDPSASPVEALPRPSLPRNVFERFTSRLPDTCRVIFTSNPTRIMFYKQDLCIFRNDTMTTMRRNSIVPSAMGTTSKEASKELVTTVCNQGHLCPLTLDSRPIYCAYEQSLRLFPLPQVLILADSYEQYNWTYNGCVVFNPGAFSADGSFVFYRPSTMEVGFSLITRESKKEATE